MRKPSLRLLILGSFGLAAPLAAYHQLTGAAEAHGSNCPYERAKAAAAQNRAKANAQNRARQTELPAASEGLPGGGSVLRAVVAHQFLP